MASLLLIKKDKSSEEYDLPLLVNLNDNEIIGRIISFVGEVESADDVFITAQIKGDYSYLDKEQSEALEFSLKEELYSIGIKLIL